MRGLAKLSLGHFPGHTAEVEFPVAFSQDCKRVMSFSHDQMIRIWNIERRELISTLQGTVAILVFITFSHKLHLLETPFEDNSEMRVWMDSRLEL